jgi:hypothetical protein
MLSNGTGLTDGVIRGIQALARFATYVITPRLVDSPFNERDARCFVQGIEVAEVVQPEACVPELEYADRDGDGTLESLLNATPNTRVTYLVTVANRDSQDLDGDLDTGEACGPPGTYTLTLNVMGDDVTLLSSTDLTFTIIE